MRVSGDPCAAYKGRAERRAGAKAPPSRAGINALPRSPARRRHELASAKTTATVTGHGTRDRVRTDPATAYSASTRCHDE